MSDFILNNWPLIVTAVPVILVIFKIIAKHTPTKVDDEIVEIIEEVKEEIQDAKKGTENENNNPPAPMP